MTQASRGTLNEGDDLAGLPLAVDVACDLACGIAHDVMHGAQLH